MSELETRQKIRFPLKERTSSIAEKEKSEKIPVTESRKQYLSQFDSENQPAIDPALISIFQRANDAYNEGRDSEAYKLYMSCTSANNF
ncbi:MAG: hypothetical protein KDD40_03945, partial [Bdellovibrionales bacterium]|nr:hypothetical protein [Bdellovibrionales bacterium]